MTVLKRIFTFLFFLFYAITAVGTLVVLAINFYWSYMFSVSLQDTIVGTQWHYSVDPISQVNYKKIIFTDSENFTFTYREVGFGNGSFIDGGGGEINGQWFVDGNGKIVLVWCHALVYGLCPKESYKDCLLCLQEERAIAQITGLFTIMLSIEGDLHSLSDSQILGKQHECNRSR